MSANTQKKLIPWDVILFFAMYIVMPEYFALEISEHLPLITVSRAVLIVMGIMLVIRRRADLFDFRNLSIKNLNLLLTKDISLRCGLLIYFVFLFAANMVHLLDLPSETIKAVFVLVAEQYVLIWLLALVIDTRQKLLQCIKILICASGFVGLIAMISVILDNNLFYYLNTVQRKMLMATYYRLGILRAEAGFGHPVYYGAFCASILPINMYLIEVEQNRRKNHLFSACMVFNIVGLVLSNSRGSLLAFICMLVIIVPVKLMMKIERKILFRYAVIALATAGMLFLATSMTALGTNYLKNIANSVLEVLISDKETPGEPEAGNDIEAPGTETPGTETPGESEEETEPEVEYGENANGVASRVVQLSGIIWTLERKPLFGFGPDAHLRGMIRYEFRENMWWSVPTFDVAIVAIIGQYGLVGMLGNIALYAGVLITLWRRKAWEDKLMVTFFLSFATIFLCLLSISSMDKTMWVLIGLFVCYVNIQHRKKESAD